MNSLLDKCVLHFKSKLASLGVWLDLYWLNAETVEKAFLNINPTVASVLIGIR